MSSFLKCRCIKNTTVEGIEVDKTYKFDSIGDVYCIKYNETSTTYETLYGNREWFYEHFIKQTFQME